MYRTSLPSKPSQLYYIPGARTDHREVYLERDKTTYHTLCRSESTFWDLEGNKTRLNQEETRPPCLSESIP